MMGTDLLIALAMIVVWELPLICPILFLLLFGFIDSIFWTANLTKIPLGGWFAVTVAAAVCLFSYIWFLGTSLKRQYAVEHEVRLLSQRETHTLLKLTDLKQSVAMLAGGSLLHIITTVIVNLQAFQLVVLARYLLGVPLLHIAFVLSRCIIAWRWTAKCVVALCCDQAPASCMLQNSTSCAGFSAPLIWVKARSANTLSINSP